MGFCIHRFYFIIVFFALLACQPKPQDRVEVHIPSVEEETEYVWRTIRDTKFFEEHNYQVSLPQGAFIEELKQKAKADSLQDEDYQLLEAFMRDIAYNEKAYQAGYNKIKDQLPLINTMISQIDAEKYSWGFQEFEKYVVNLTLYGPGGSFNPEEGSILIYTTPSGQFKGYENPANTIIHEIIHIGIEKSIIGKYNVPHAFKERLVDTYVSLAFQEYLPDYKVQDMGEYRSDEYLKELADFEQLDDVVAKLLSEKK